jgi:hypothetical protein
MPLFSVNNNCPNLIPSIVLTCQKVFAMFRLFIDDKKAISPYLAILSSINNLNTANTFLACQNN